MTISTQRPKNVKVKTRAKATRFLLSPAGKVLLVLLALTVTVGAVAFTHYYVKYSRLIDEKLRIGPFADTSKIYAASKAVSVGDRMSSADLVDRLRRAGYGEASSNRVGWYHVRSDAVEIIPGPDAVEQEAGVVKFSGEKISSIVSTQDHTQRTQFQVEPELI